MIQSEAGKQVEEVVDVAVEDYRGLLMAVEGGRIGRGRRSGNSTHTFATRRHDRSN